MRVLLLAAFRGLLRRPVFTASAMVLLALGAGSNAAVFAVVRGILLQPLPFAAPDRLVAIGVPGFLAEQDLVHWRERARSFSGIAGQSPGWLMGLVAAGGEPLKVTGARVTDNIFQVLGVQAVVGRTIAPGDSAPGRAMVALLSHELWEHRFASDPAVVGKTIALDGIDHTVVGVMGRGFEILGPGTDLWAPQPYDPTSSTFKATFFETIARLAPGASPATATQELGSLAPEMRQALAYDASWGRTLTASPLNDVIVGDIRQTVLLLFGAVALVLVLVAVNLGTLMLGRGVERARELAVRTAVGASRARLVAEMLVEHALLAMLGAAVGLAGAWATLPLLISHIPPEMPRVASVGLDVPSCLLILVVTVAITLLAGLVPALLSARSDVQPLLREARSTDTPGRRRILGALVTTQIALAIVLGVGAGLMVRSLWNLQHQDPGFVAERVLTLRLQTTTKHDSLETGLPYFERVVERLRALPGVTAVGALGHLPMTGYSWKVRVWRVDSPVAPGVTSPSVGWRFVGWDYFRAMGIPLRYGRVFAASDGAHAPDVGILSEDFARQLFGDPTSALGQDVVQSSGRGTYRVRIVGVSGNVRHLGLDAPPQPEIYRPLAQTFMFPMAFVVRTDGPPARLAAAARQAAWDIDPFIPVAELQPLSTLLADSIARPRLLALLLSVSAGVGLLLEVVGVYGVVAYRVRQRTREFGLRLALGALPAGIARLIVRQGLGFALGGIAVGVPAAFALSRVMASVVYGVTARDPLVFTTLPIAALVATVGACAWPALRAARVDPGVTLRQD